MNLGLIILLTLVGWRLGPIILRTTGTLLLLLALLVWAIPTAPHTNASMLASTTLIGAVMRAAGTTWRRWRESGGLYRRIRARGPRNVVSPGSARGVDLHLQPPPD